MQKIFKCRISCWIQ